MTFNLKSRIRSAPLLLAAAGSLLCGIPSAAQTASLQGDIRVHDPAMIRARGIWYVYSTGQGIPFKTSRDRIDWKNTGRVFSKATLPAWHQHDIPGQNGNLWAPDIRYADGK